MNRDVLLTVITRVLMLFAGLATSVFTARLLGPAGRGEYFLVVIFAATVVQFANLGLHTSNLYQLARDPTQLGGLLANSLWISLLLGTGIGVLGVAVRGLFGSGPNVAPLQLWLGVALVPPTLFFLLGGNLLIALARVAAYNVLQIASALLLLLALAAGWLVGGGVSTYLAATVLAWVVVAAGTLGALCWNQRLSWRFRGDLLQAGWGFAARVHVTCLLSFLLVRSNVFILDAIAGQAENGFYSVAAQIADVMWIFPTSLGLILFPRLVKRAGRGTHEFRRQLAGMAAVMLVLSLACAVCIAPFVRLVFGEAYLPAVPVVLWMLPGVFFHSLSVIVSQFLAARGNPLLQTAAWLPALGLQFAVSSQLVPRYAAMGAAASFSLSAAVAFGSLFALEALLARSAGVMNSPLTRSSALGAAS